MFSFLHQSWQSVTHPAFSTRCRCSIVFSSSFWLQRVFKRGSEFTLRPKICLFGSFFLFFKIYFEVNHHGCFYLPQTSTPMWAPHSFLLHRWVSIHVHLIQGRFWVHFQHMPPTEILWFCRIWWLNDFVEWSGGGISALWMRIPETIGRTATRPAFILVVKEYKHQGIHIDHRLNW